MPDREIRRAAELLSRASRVVTFTGAGVSAESGVATFRGAGGLWEGSRVEEVATPGAFGVDPAKVWRFYEARRRQLAAVAPNPGHGVMARWRNRFSTYALVTQNVDGLHQRAGAVEVQELHGSIWRIRCSRCAHLRDDRRVPLPDLPPRCAVCGALERPDIVWFGEALPELVLAAAVEAAMHCEVLLVVGTSAVVYPAAGLVEIAADHGASIIEVNPEPSALAGLADCAVRAPSGVALPRIDALLAEGERASQ